MSSNDKRAPDMMRSLMRERSMGSLMICGKLFSQKHPARAGKRRAQFCTCIDQAVRQHTISWMKKFTTTNRLSGKPWTHGKKQSQDLTSGTSTRKRRSVTRKGNRTYAYFSRLCAIRTALIQPAESASRHTRKHFHLPVRRSGRPRGRDGICCRCYNGLTHLLVTGCVLWVHGLSEDDGKLVPVHLRNRKCHED